MQQLRKSGNAQPSPETKRLNGEHKEKHGTAREPLLNGIASDYDLKLFRRAQVVQVIFQYQ